jgi:hypothetical protein
MGREGERPDQEGGPWADEAERLEDLPFSCSSLSPLFLHLERTELHPAAWDIMVEHMAEHSVGRIQHAYFQSQLSLERLKDYYMASYGAIRLGYPP